MTRLFPSLIVFIIVSIHTVHPFLTSIYQTNKNLSVDIQSISKEDFLIVGLNNKNFVKLDTKDEDIRIICTKQNGQTYGKMSAFVNTQQAKSMKCLAYEQGQVDNEAYCLKQEFRFTLPARGYSYYDVLCRYVHNEGQKGIHTFLHRLYDDAIPRIRSGLHLDNIHATVEHTINLEKMSCESVKSTSESTFNALQWFTAFNKSIGFNTVSNQITDELYIYKSDFPVRSRHVANNTIYKCCTILNGQIQHCQQFLANIYAIPTTAKQVTTRKTTLQTTLASSTRSKPTTQLKMTISSTEHVKQSAIFTSKTVRKVSITNPLSIPIAEPVSTKTSTQSMKKKDLKVNKAVRGYIDESMTKKDSTVLSDNEIGIVIACTGGVVILALALILFLLCYKKHRYGHDDTDSSEVQGKKVRRMELPPTRTLSDELTVKKNEIPFSAVATNMLAEELHNNRNQCPMANKTSYESELNANRNQCPMALEKKNSTSSYQEDKYQIARQESIYQSEIDANRNQCPMAKKNSTRSYQDELNANRNQCPMAAQNALDAEMKANREQCPRTKHIEETSQMNELINHAYPDRDMKKLSDMTTFDRNSQYQAYLQNGRLVGFDRQDDPVKYSEPHASVLPNQASSPPPPPPPMPAPSLSNQSNLSIIDVKRNSPENSSFFPPPPPPIFGLNQINSAEPRVDSNRNSMLTRDNTYY